MAKAQRSAGSSQEKAGAGRSGSGSDEDDDWAPAPSASILRKGVSSAGTKSGGGGRGGGAASRGKDGGFQGGGSSSAGRGRGQRMVHVLTDDAPPITGGCLLPRRNIVAICLCMVTSVMAGCKSIFCVPLVQTIQRACVRATIYACHKFGGWLFRPFSQLHRLVLRIWPC